MWFVIFVNFIIVPKRPLQLVRCYILTIFHFSINLLESHEFSYRRDGCKLFFLFFYRFMISITDFAHKRLSWMRSQSFGLTLIKYYVLDISIMYYVLSQFWWRFCVAEKLNKVIFIYLISPYSHRSAMDWKMQWILNHCQVFMSLLCNIMFLFSNGILIL